jgi:hypothetical protein
MQSTRFDMGTVMNRLRSIVEAGPEDHQSTPHHDPGMETGGNEIDNASFTRTMQRLSAIKDAVAEDHFNALRAGVRALYMNRRPNLQQMTALMDLLETVLSYVAEDNALFQRLKGDLAKDKQASANSTAPAAGPEVGAPSTAAPVAPTASMRDLKA